MDRETNLLWGQLAAMRIEPEGAALGFAARLARENGWTGTHAGAVVGEYRRFLLLAATGGPATPSEEVDQAWHLHLGYTRHYWDVLCGRILKRPLHHDPTEGGPAERARYRRQYEATLARYRTLFGVAPPPAIWPEPAVRFAARPVRIDRSLYWLLPRAPARAGAALAASSLPLAACTLLAANGGSGVAVHEIAAGAVMIVAGLVILLSRSRRSPDRRDGDGGGGGDAGCGSDGGSGCGGGCGGE